MNGYSEVNVARGALTEYTSASNPLELNFAFNPATITRSRTIEFKTGEGKGDAGGYNFSKESDVPVVSQSVTVKPESFTVKILLDATDRMGAAGDQQAKDGWNPEQGVQPELDILRSMAEPKLQTAGGASTLAALGQGSNDASSNQPYASILLFIWGEQTLPVFMTQVQIEVKAFLPSLVPYRAEATLTLQIIESQNPFYNYELKRQFDLAAKASSAVYQGYKTPQT